MISQVMKDTLTEKQSLFLQVATQLEQPGFTIASEDASRPWGGFFVIDEAQAQ